MELWLQGSVGNLIAVEEQRWTYSCILVAPAWLLKTTIAFQNIMENIRNTLEGTTEVLHIHCENLLLFPWTLHEVWPWD